MFRVLRRAVFAGAMFVLAACSDASRDPTAISPPAKRDYLTLSVNPDETVWDMAEVDSEYGSDYSYDDSPAGNAFPLYVEADFLDEAVVCRDQNDYANLYWNSPDEKGVVLFQVGPPLRFRGYTGYFTDRRKLRWRTAVFSVDQSADGEDNAGNVWRFRGRFNAICRMGQTRIGLLQINAQLVVPQGLIDRPVLVRSGTGDNGGCGNEYQLVYDPYDPYSPTDAGDDCERSGDGSGGDSGDASGGDSCRSEYVVIEVSYDDGATWQVYWEGYATVCD
ncbi:MAG TPA: hypothetical protein VGB92_19245 [Longimicrobium sp.]